MEQQEPTEPNLGFPEPRDPEAGTEQLGFTTLQPVEPAAPAAPVTDAVQSLVGQAKEQVAGKASAGKDGLADQLEGLADIVHRSGEQFAGKQDWIAQAIDSGAQELTSLAQALRQNDLGSLFSQVQSFAKRQPGIFVGASLAAGFALARLGKVVAADVSRDDLPTMPEVGHVQQ